MPSWQSRVVNALLPLRGGKRMYSSAERTEAEVARRSVRPARYAPPRSLDRVASISVRRPHGWPVYRLRPKRAAAGMHPNRPPAAAAPAPAAAPATVPAAGPAVRHVVYIHGGGYIREIVRSHWRLARVLVRDVPAVCDVPIYPLAPHSTAAETVPAVAEIVRAAMEEAGPGRPGAAHAAAGAGQAAEKAAKPGTAEGPETRDVVVVGDSAGGGLALAAALHLRDRFGLRPSHLVLISPWVDCTLSDPRQAEIEPRDRMLGRAGARRAARMYAGALDLDHPLVSPLYGGLRGLGPMTVFSGTADILNTDARRLVERAKEAGVEVGYHEVADLPHAYPLMPFPEGRQARRLIVDIVRGSA